MTTTTVEGVDFIGHREVLAMAYDLIDTALPGWKFMWDNAATRLARCNGASKRITMSRPLTERISRRQAHDALLHEIAHALTPGHHHDAVWVAKHRELGGSGNRTYSTRTGEVAEVRKPFLGTCPNCGRSKAAHKRSRVACGDCCARYSGGRFDERYLVVWTRVYG